LPVLDRSNSYELAARIGTGILAIKEKLPIIIIFFLTKIRKKLF